MSKRFGAQAAVDGVTLGLRKGEIFSLLGPSGCGKTTLLRTAAGFEAPDTGRVFLDGQDITALPPNKRRLNTIFQNYALFPHLSVYDNIAFGLRISRRPKQEIDAEVGRMLALIQLEAQAHKKPAQILYRPEAVLLVQVYSFLPFAILPVYAAADKFDFHLLEAAQDLGAHKFTAFILVFLPGISLVVLFVTLGVPQGLFTIFLSHVTFCVSYVAMVVLGRLQDFDYTVIDAARDLGADGWTAVRKVLVPLIAPGIVMPREGSVIASDDFAILKDAKEPGLAHAFINFFLDPRVSAENMEHIYYLAPNAEARAYLSEGFLKTAGGMLDPHAYENCEVIRDLGEDTRKYNAIWDEIKAAE